MVVAIVLLAAGLVVVSVISAVIAGARRNTALARFSRRFGLEVPEGMDETIRSGVQAWRRGAPIGALVGVTVATVVLLAFPGFQLLAIWWCLFGSYLLGAGLGATLSVLITEGRRESGVVRIARTEALRVSDYVSPYQTWFGWLCVLLAVCAFAANLWLAAAYSRGYLSVVSGILVGLALVTVVLYQVVARRAVRKGALAGTPLELAWDDALRSYALVNLNGMVALIALYSLVTYDTLVITVPSRLTSDPLYGLYTGLLPIAATVAIVSFGVAMTSTSSRQYFLRRLWPKLVPTPAVSEETVPEVMGTR